MKTVTAKEMQYIDRITIDSYGLPGEVLMGQAGRAVYNEILLNFKGLHRVILFSGTGNNGGDGFVIAYHLKNSGIDARCLIIGSPDKMSNESRIYYNLCKNTGIEVEEADSSCIASIAYDKYDLIVDSMSGTGFTGAARGLLQETIRSINNFNSNNSSVPVVSVDIPSGLPSDGEAPEGEVIHADLTVTIGLPKISLVTYPGKYFTGMLKIVDIGFPADLVNSPDIKTALITTEKVIPGLGLQKDSDTYKNAEGHLLLIGGFSGMEGAIMLAAMAALETGVGLVTILTVAGSREIIAGKIPEAMTYSLAEDDIFNSLKNIFNEKNYDAVVMGPGMGRNTLAGAVTSCIIENMSDFKINKLLIDGDGLYHTGKLLQTKKTSLPDNIILTPHFMEASRLAGIPVNYIKNNRLNSARDCSKFCNGITVLKGPASIVSDGINSFINTTGNPAMATGGSGDVLSGIIGSLMLKNESLLDAATSGVFIHGKAADLYCAENSVDILKAGDLISCIRHAIKSIL